MLNNLSLALANLEHRKGHSLVSFLGLSTLTTLICLPAEPPRGRGVESQARLPAAAGSFAPPSALRFGGCFGLAEGGEVVNSEASAASFCEVPGHAVHGRV